MNISKDITDEQALKNFLLDIKSLEKLSEWSNQFNIFNVLKISNAEIRHSNMLAWLLNPNETHGLGDCVLRGLIQELVKQNNKIDVFNALIMDLHSFVVKREWKNIDILIISHSQKFLICIENKVFSSEHDKQLKRYYTNIENEYFGYEKIFVYLTPYGDSPEKEEDSNIWQTVSYGTMIDIILKSKDSKTVSDEVEVLIEHYINTIRRKIVGDYRLKKICQEIYAKHKQALDLIFENRDDITLQICEEVQKWCFNKHQAGCLDFDPQNSTKTSVKFTTKAMTTIFPELEEPVSGWKTKSYYFYEVAIRNNAFVVTLAVSSINLTEEQKEKCNKISGLLGKSDKKKDWTWKRLMTCKEKCKIEDDILNEDGAKKIVDVLNKNWKEIERFETELMNRINA